MDAKKISTQVPFGKLTAEIGADPNYPTIYVYLERPDGIEIDLVAVSMDQLDTIKAYIYEDTTKDDYTEDFVWREEQLNIDYEEEI